MSQMSTLRQFSSDNKQPEPVAATGDKPKVSYTFNAEDIKGTTRGTGGLLLMAYTCSKCETKQARTFSKDSYTKGVVLLRCGGCDKLHLIADNIGWFEDDGPVNIEDIMKRKGDNVHTNMDDNSIEINLKPEG